MNTRYRGTITGYGYDTESSLLRAQGGQQMTAGGLLAGGAVANLRASGFAEGWTDVLGRIDREWPSIEARARHVVERSSRNADKAVVPTQLEHRPRGR